MYHECCLAVPRGAMGLSAVCICDFPDHTHLLFFIQYGLLLLYFKDYISKVFMSISISNCLPLQPSLGWFYNGFQLCFKLSGPHVVCLPLTIVRTVL